MQQFTNCNALSQQGKSIRFHSRFLSFTLYGVGGMMQARKKFRVEREEISMEKFMAFEDWAASGLWVHINLLHYLRRSCSIDFPWLKNQELFPPSLYPQRRS